MYCEENENEYNIELGRFDSFGSELDIEYVIWFIIIVIILWSLL